MDEGWKELIKDLKEQVNKIDEKVDRLLAFKWQIIGGSLAASTIIGVIIQILLAHYGR